MMMMMNCIDLGGVKGLLGWHYVGGNFKHSWVFTSWVAVLPD